MNSKPVSYETLKSVFKHTDANKRIEFSFNCPAVRTAERAAPIFIDTLVYHVRGIKLNENVYEIPMTPEDVKFYEKWAVQEKYLNNALKDKERTASNYEEALSDKKRGVENSFANRHSFEELLSTLDKTRAGLRACKTQHDRISRAMMQLGAYLFGGRRFPIQVNFFENGPDTIRLPEGVTFHIRQLTPHHLRLSSETILRPIIHESSYPLECVHIDIRTMDDDWNWAFQSAKKISIYWYRPFYMFHLLCVIHPNVHLVHGRFLNPKQLEFLIDDWMKESRPVGTQLTIDDNEDDRNSKMEMIKSSFNVEMTDVSPAVIPISNGTKLVVSVFKNSNKNERTWTTMIKVEAGTEQEYVIINN